MQPFFRVLKSITQDKRSWDNLDEEEKNSINNWILNKFISMKLEFVELVNFIQKNTWQMPTKYLYNIYLDIIPKRYTYIKYIKAKNSDKYKDEDIKIIANYYQISKREALEYLQELPKEEFESIKNQMDG